MVAADDRVAALAVSVAQIPRNAVATSGLLAAGIGLVGVFVIVDWRMHAAMLPPSVFAPGPLKWIYLTMAVLMVRAMVNTYVPLFGQRLAHLTPVAAGFLGAALALGWTVSEIVSASLENPRTIGRVVMVAPLVVASGLALGAVAQRDDASAGIVALWAVALLVAGIGIGMAWPHLSARAMDSVDDPAEGGAAAAAINTVQLISAAFGAGLAGVVVNTANRWRGDGGPLAVHGVHRAERGRRGRFVRRDARHPASRAGRRRRLSRRSKRLSPRGLDNLRVVELPPLDNVEAEVAGESVRRGAPECASGRQ